MYVPTIGATYAAGAAITFMNAWNNYMWARLMCQITAHRHTYDDFLAMIADIILITEC